MKTSPINITIREINSNEIDWVNAKYDEVGFVHSVLTNEFIAVATINGERAGIGRLVIVSENEAELGGMFVFAAYRKHGVAGQIVSFLLDHSNPEHTVYCLPFVHLRSFYEKFGFRDCSLFAGLKVPEEVRKKHLWCNTTYEQETLLMVRLKRS